VLCALTFTDAFRAGASYYGIGDLESLFATTHEFEARYDYWLLGADSGGDDVHRERSPLQHADRLDCLVIFFQGGRDRVVPPEQSQVMARASREKGLPVAYLEFPEEAHGFRQASTIQRVLEAELYFYCRLLGLTLPDVPPLHIDNLPDGPG
jgi:dipeptidyl aminopeptidase/acylaminoacyl peptidase